MTDRDHSPAYQMLPRRALRVFAAIERAIGNGTSAIVSYSDFRFDHHIGRQSISVSLKLLDHLGLIEMSRDRALRTSSGSRTAGASDRGILPFGNEAKWAARLGLAVSIAWPESNSHQKR